MTAANISDQSCRLMSIKMKKKKKNVVCCVLYVLQTPLNAAILL